MANLTTAEAEAIRRSRHPNPPCVCVSGSGVCAYHQTKALHEQERCWGKPQCPFCNGEPGYDRP